MGSLRNSPLGQCATMLITLQLWCSGSGLFPGNEVSVKIICLTILLNFRRQSTGCNQRRKEKGNISGTKADTKDENTQIRQQQFGFNR